MIVGIDVDGVLRDLVAGLTETYLRVYPQDIELIRPTTEWDLSKQFPIGEAIWNFMWKEYPWEVMFENAAPYDGALQFIVELAQMKVHTVLVTYQPSYESRRATWHWLEHYGFTDFAHSVVLLGEAGLGKGRLGVDILLDDGQHNLDDCEYTPTLPVCMDRPWNQDWLGHRVYSYRDFLKLVERHLRWKHI